ncbi:MAG TPA: muconolactone Delta-isomerase family protein [Baekduia sp.]|uniref:muconolactone Delta-isomerase family protein n=1 Tax=Baekduia sp. TaxID=2600305 RepID=UPI002D79893B|nr:muconolactone Delta-isomerase family protein [Baekduia sp.]HET6507984.1 muconolactone Delta-isomerase family protein [Baekduia sp.]
MHDYLVRIDVALPPTLPDDELQALIDAERVRGRELRGAGTIQRIWRLPGGLRNVAIWRAPDATALHEALTSLPTYKYATIAVDALAVHPLEADDA